MPTPKREAIAIKKRRLHFAKKLIDETNLPMDQIVIASGFGFLAQRAIPGVEAIEQCCYRRTISLNGHSGTICVAFDESEAAVQVGISFPESRWLFLIIEHTRATIAQRQGRRGQTGDLNL